MFFFPQQQKNDFPLYTEGIKFFNHPEGMVRIAVRTLTLNVYKGNINILQINRAVQLVNNFIGGGGVMYC